MRLEFRLDILGHLCLEIQKTHFHAVPLSIFPTKKSEMRGLEASLMIEMNLVSEENQEIRRRVTSFENSHRDKFKRGF